MVRPTSSFFPFFPFFPFFFFFLAEWKLTGTFLSYRIEATHRWCLTATPIQNKLEELFSLIYFLRIRPYCDWTTFRDEIVRPMKNGVSQPWIRFSLLLNPLPSIVCKEGAQEGASHS